jgi:hypothetical protein
MSNPLVITRQVVAYAVGATQAMVTVDADPYADRIVIIDRNTAAAVANIKVVRNMMKVRVPFTYISANNLIVGILDDDGQYGAKFVDGVKAEVIDPKVTTIR